MLLLLHLSITGCTAIINGGTFNGTLGSTSSNTNGSITINGGAFKADPSAYVPSGVNQLNNTATDGYYYVGEAKVGTAGYSTLEQAYASLTGDGRTIELLCDVTTEKPIDVNKTVIFKSFTGNKFKITAADSFSGDRMFITQYGHDGGMKTLNIQDLELVGKSGVRHVYVYWGRYANFTNVKFTNGDANGGKGGSLYISGRVNIKNCQFENNTASSSGAAVYVTLERSDISPVVNIDGCTVDCSAAANAICIDNAAATVNLRENTSVTASTSTVINNGTLNVTNSNITSTQSAITNNGTVTVNSGNVIGTRFGIVNTDKVYIKGGTVEGTGNEGISNGSQADRIAKVEISGGTVKGAYAICDYSQYDAENHPEYLNIITGGTVENTSTAISTIGVYAGDGGTWSITGGLFKHASGSSAGILDTKIKWQESETLAWTKDTTNTDYYTPVTAVAKIGDVNYPSLNAAFAAVSQDGTQTTITLLCDTTMTERVNISTGTVNVTLDLQGYTLTGPSGNDAILFLSNNTASVTVENGKLVSNGLMVIASQSGNITLEDVTVDYTGKGNYAILTQGLSSTLTLKGNTVINSSSVAIYAYSNGTANIENATVNGGLTADGGNINITKGTFSVDPTTIAGITFDAEAKITNNEGTVVYDTLVNALIGVKSGETIDILNNIDVASEYAMYDKTFTINGGGHTLKRVYGNSDNLLAVTSGKVTVKNIIVDGGAIWSGDNPATRVNSGLTAVCNNRYNGQLVFVGGSGEFVLGEGAILQNNLRTGSTDGVSDGGSAVVTNGNGIFTMQNGSIIRDCTVYNTASLDGSLGGDGAAISLWESSSANINGGLITGNFAPRMGGTIRVASAAATLNISGGTITGNYTKAKSFGNLALTGHNINISGSPEIYDNYAVPHYADDGYHTAEKVQSHIVIYNDGSINADGLDVQKPIMISFTTAQASTDELTGELAVNRVAGTIMQGGAQYADMFTTAIDGYIVYVDGNDLVTKQLTDSDNIVYVDKNAAVGGDGTRNHPFNVLNQDVFADARLTANGGYIVLLSDVDKSTYISNGTGIHTNNQQLVIISEGNKKTITDQTNTLNYTYWHLNAGYAFNLVLDHVILDGTGGNTTDYGGFFIGDGGTLTLNHGTVLQNYVNRAVNVRPGGQLNIYEGCQIINNKANLNAPYNTLDGVDGVENVGGAVYVCAGGRLQLCNESTDKNYIGKQILIEGNKDADGNSTGIYLESGSYMNTAAANALVKDQIYVNPTSDTYIGEVNTTLLFHRYQQFDNVYLADGASIGKNGTQEKPIGITMQNAAVGAEAVHIYSGGTQDLDMFKTDGSYLLAAVDSAYVVVQPEAKIGNTLYYTLADAVADAQNGQTVDMLTDITATAQIKIPEGKDITVNLGGYTVRRDSAGVNMFSVDAGGRLTLENGTLDGNNVSLAPSGTNTTTNQNLVQVNGSFKATDVTFTNAVTRWGAIITYANSELELTGCEISGNRTNDEPNSCGAAIHAYGTVKLTDCTITNNTELNSAESCSAVHLKNSASVELCGTNYIYDNMRGENQANIILAANNQITVSSSIADSKIGVTAGNFTPVAKGTESYTVATADALRFVDDSGAMLAAKSGNTVLFSQAVAEINGVKYASLADAVAMANSGDTVILLGDVTLNSKLVIEKDITITSADGENYKIIRAESFANDDLISVGSDADVTLLNVTVDGNGVEITKDGVNLINVNGGSLTIEDGTLITGHNDITETGNTKGTVFAAGGATVTMNGGEISGNKALYGSAVTAYNTSDGNVNTFTMNGGIITENISTGRENGTVAGAVQVGQNGSTFNMNGGEIIDNTAVNAYGAGVTVLNGGVMNVKGDATVFDNTAADKQNNVYLIDGATLNVTGALENNIGVTAANGAPNVTASGYKLTEDDAFKLIEDTGAFAPEFSDGNVSFETAVAENVNSGLRYTTLATAANKANADDTINILCDITLTSGQVSIDKNLTIDLGGHTLKRGNNNGALLAVPQGAVANLTVKNGTLDGDKETYSTSNVSRYALVNTESNSVVVFTAEKVTFKNNYGRYGGALFMTSGEGNSAHLNDCVVTGNRAYQCGGAFHLYAPVYLNNCIITDNYDDMTGDNIGSNGYALHMKDNTAVYLSGKIVITGNTSGNNNTPANLPVYATTPIYIEGALNDGSAIGVKVIDGNIIASGTESYTVTNADAIKFIDDTGEKAAVKSENTVVWAEPAVSVNGVNYAKLSDAIAAIPDGEETSIVLKADINETLTIPANKNVVLDLAGFTVDASSTNGSGITNNGTLTVKDSSEAQTGTVTGRYGISNNGEFTLLSGTLVGTGNDGIFNSPDATSLTVAGGTIKGNNLAICDYATNGTVELLGGVLECTGTGSSAGTGYVIGSYGSNVGGSWTIATDGSVVMKNANHTNAVKNSGTATLNDGIYIGTGTYASVYEDSTNDAVSTVIGGGTYNQTAIADTVTGGEFKNLTVSDSVSDAAVNGKLTWTSEEPNVSNVTFGENATLGNKGYEIDGNTVKRAPITVNSLEELNAAISNAKPDDIIKLGTDIEGSITISEGLNIILDLNGHTLTGNGTNAAVTNNGTLIVRDSSADSTGTLTGATGIVNNGNATIEGGNVLGTTGHAVENKSTGTLLVTGDAYISGEVRGIYNNGGNLTVTGDDVEIYGNTGSAVTTFNGGTATLNGGTYDAVAYAAISTGDNSQTTINGGSYDGAYVTTITGGSFTGNVSVSDSIKDATVNGTLIWTSEEPNVTNVTFGENAKLDNKYYKIDGNTVVKLETITVNSLDELNDAIKAGIPNIKLGADIEGQITIPEGSNVTLDLNGHSITTADKHTIQVENNAKLTVMDSSPDKSGKIEATSTEGVHHAIQNRGDVVVEGGTIIGAKSGINLTSEGNGTVVINGGTVQGTSGSGVINDSSYDGVALTVNGGSIIGNTSGIYNWDADVKTVINGGEITATAGSGVDNNGGELTVTGGNIIGAMQGINTNGVVNITGDASISGTENNGIYNYGGGVLTVTGNASIEGKQNAVCNNATATLNGGTYTGHGTYASVYEDSTNDAVSTVIGGGTYNQTAIADTVTGGEFKNLTVSDSVSSATVNGKLTWTSEEPNVSDVTFGENATLGNEGYEIDGNTVKRVSITVNSLEELNAAISNAKPDDVIKLGADIYITDSLNILEGKNITIEGNGHSIIRDENYKGNVFNVEGSLTLNSVIVDGNNVNANTPLILVNGGTVTLNDGSTLKNAQNTETDGGNNAGGAVNITNGGSFIMNDGSSIENCEYRYGGAVLVGNTNGTQGTFVMNGGEISGCNASSTGNGYGGGAVYVWHGTADLNGGEISGNTANNGVGNDIYVYGSDASVELSGGIKVDDLYKDTNSNLYITGELSGAIGVTTDAAAGTIVAQPKDNYTITDADADKLIVENRDLEIKDGNVVITDALIVNSLEELNAAIGNARPGDIIKLGTDIEGSITIPEDVDITIDLNGHIITGTNNVPVITNNGTLTLVDTSGEQSGQIIGIGNNGTGILNGSDATLRVDGGKISATGEATAAVENNGSATISGGTLTAEKGINNLGDLTVSGGTITGNKFDGITNGNTEVKNATVNMSGGTVEGVKYAICDYASDSVNTITGGTLVNLEGEEGGIQGNGYVLSAHRDNIGGTWVIATDGSVQFRNDEGTTNFVNGVAADGTPSSSQIKVENFDTLKFTDTDGDGVYTVIKDVSTDILRYINLSLNGAIGVNLYFDLPQSYFDGGYDLIYQVAGGEAQQISVSNELEQDTDGTWIFPLSVNAKQMTDSISFWFENSGEVVSETRTTTVAEYAYYILGSGIETLNCGANDSTQLKALMAAMLNYGAEAQNYFSYNTENLANSNLGNYTNDNGDAYADYFTALDSTMFDDTNAWNVADGEFFAGSDETREGITDIDVELGDTTTMNIYFRVAKGTDLSNYRFNVTHTELYGNGNYYNLNEYAYAAIEQSDEQFDYYYVSIQNIPAAYLDHTFRLEITKEGNKIATLETMVTYYIKQQAVDNPTDEALTQIATSLYWYNYYANLYFRY